MNSYKKKSSEFLKRIVKNNSYQKRLYEKWGESYMDYRKAWEGATSKQMLSDFPLHIDIDTIDSCNLHCPHCSEEWTSLRSGLKMDINLLDSVFEEAAFYGLCSLNIGSVAEPLLEKKNVFYALERAREIEIMETFLHTNGIFLKEDISDKLIELELTYLCISVDAPDEETYKKVRGGNFNLLKKNIETFKRIRDSIGAIFPFLRLSFLRNSRNRDQEEQFLQGWSKVGDIIEVQPLIDYEMPLPELLHCALVDCYAPWRRLMVGVDGRMGLCCSKVSLEPDLILGNIVNMSIYEAWNSEKAKQIRNAHVKKDFSDFPTCYRCLARLTN